MLSSVVTIVPIILSGILLLSFCFTSTYLYSTETSYNPRRFLFTAALLAWTILVVSLLALLLNYLDGCSLGLAAIVIIFCTLMMLIATTFAVAALYQSSNSSGLILLTFLGLLTGLGFLIGSILMGSDAYTNGRNISC